jgi:octaprenyl-diphosphate synthase
MAGKSSSSCKYLPTEARHGGLYNYKAHWMRFCTNRLGSTELPSRIFHLSASENSTAAVLELVAPDMAQVDRVIAQRLDSGVPLVAEVARYIISAGGKRLRPVLLLLTCGALGYTGAQRHNLAAVVEFIHTATLLHDDVVDESTLRRGRPTANENFGNPASVLVGDFLYSRAFQMMVDADSMRVMQTLADATNVIAEGEVLQLMNMHDASLDEDGYLRVIRSKTAKLFEASARLGPILAGSPPEIENACAHYGQALGTAFQVIDDVLDYDGNSAEMGKNLGDDLREGKATLPLILAMQRGDAAQSRTVREAIETGNVDRLNDIVAIVRDTGALAATRSAAAAEAQRAIDAAMQLPDNAYRTAMVALASQLLDRRT